MTVSANPTPDFQRDQLITAAYRLCGMLPSGADPDADQIAAGSIHFSLALLELQSQGVVLTSKMRTTLALAASDAEYTLDTDTIDVVVDADNVIGSIVDSAGVETPVFAITASEYQRITTKTSESAAPTKCFIDKGGNPLVAVFWPVPEAITTFRYTKVRLLRDNDDGSTTMELRRTWAPWMTYRVAAGVACDNSKFELSDRFRGWANDLVEKAKSTDVQHVTVQFRPGHSGKNWR